MNSSVSERTASSASQVPRLVRLAVDRHQSGCLQEAQQLYDQILQAEPDHADALHNSGLIAHHRGQSEQALTLLTRAIEKAPTRALYFVTLGQVLEARGERQQAIRNYRQATVLDPGLKSAYHQLGNALLKQRQLDQAAHSYARALSLEPDSPEVINSLGSLLYAAGRPEQAVVCYQKAIALEADYAEAHNNLGIALRHLGRLNEAVASCTRAIELKPTLAAAYSNLGEIFVLLGNFPQALEPLCQALAIEPGFAEAYINLGNAYRGQGLLFQAIACYEQAIALSGSGGACNNMGETYRDLGQLQKAVASFHQALAASPPFLPAYSNLLHLYAFTRYNSPAEEKTQAQGWEKIMLTEEERAAARKRAPPGSGVFPIRQPIRQQRPLRLGIVSAELGAHAVGQFLLPLLEQLDHSRFHLTLFPTARRFCTQAQQFRDLADSYLPLTELADGPAAERIRSAHIDVLMDTTGHTHGCRLGIFAHRAAPVQCTYLGYWSTTGLTEMDWVFANPDFPPALDAHFTEQVWRLPRHTHCYLGKQSLPETQWKPDPGGAVWLGSFNKISKVHEQTLALWSKILHALPQAKLLLEDTAADEQETHRRILATLSTHGIAHDRVCFIPHLRGHQRHMSLYHRLDIALDTIPFNSGTTAFDALWMGVPLVAIEGDWSGARIASAILRSFGRPDWVAQDEGEYVSIVDRLARDVEGRRKQRATQRARMLLSPLCDAPAMARAMEDVLEGMYHRWAAGQGTSR